MRLEHACCARDSGGIHGWEQIDREQTEFFDAAEALQNNTIGIKIMEGYFEFYDEIVRHHSGTRSGRIRPLQSLMPEERRAVCDRAFAELARRMDGPGGEDISGRFSRDLLYAIQECRKLVDLCRDSEGLGNDPLLRRRFN